MTNEEARKIAEALGQVVHVRYPDSMGPDHAVYSLRPIQDAYDGGPQRHEQWQPVSCVPAQEWENRDFSEIWQDFEKWLDSAEGREKVRDKVRVLLKARGWAYENRWWLNTGDSETFALAMGPVHYEPQGAYLTPEHFEEADTEKEMWLSALEFLSKEER